MKNLNAKFEGPEFETTAATIAFDLNLNTR